MDSIVHCTICLWHSLCLESSFDSFENTLNLNNWHQSEPKTGLAAFYLWHCGQYGVEVAHLGVEVGQHGVGVGQLGIGWTFCV